MNRYKVGDMVFDPENPDYTFKIIRVNQKTYRYKVFCKDTYLFDNSFSIKRFEDETRKFTKLDEALK